MITIGIVISAIASAKNVSSVIFIRLPVFGDLISFFAK
jgi:hypothetical protein